MKKFLLFLFCCTTPITAGAADIFDSAGAFTVVKAVKLGRSRTASAGFEAQLDLQSNICLAGHYYWDVNGCQACSDAMTGCLECESAAVCKKCDENNKYVLTNNSCTLSVCSWNHNDPVLLATECPVIDGYGKTSSITVQDTNPKYGTVNIRFWDNATVSGGAFTTTNLKSTDHTSWELDNLDSVITFNNPVTVTGTVVLQESSSDAAQGVKMLFNGGLNGNPRCVVEKQVASQKVETNMACECTSNGLPNPVCQLYKFDSTCTDDKKFVWYADGSMTIPSGYSCIDGYGANSNITMPSGTPSYSSVNLRFWDSASVSGSFTTNELSSLTHAANKLSDLDAVITFKDPVTVNGTVKLAEASGSKLGNRKGVKMVFKGGLKGNPKCVVEKQIIPSSGCGDQFSSASPCVSTQKTSAVCECSSSECVIKDRCPAGYAYREAKSPLWSAGCFSIGDCDTVRPDLEEATCMRVSQTTGKGTCATDDASTSSVCSDIGKGYAWRNERSGVWTAGYYPVGNCPTLRPDLKGATCMDMGENKQCKTDNTFSSTECLYSREW